MKKVFNTEYSANEFSKKVEGKVRASYLPDYMSVIPIWVVEWDNKDFYIYQENQIGADRYFDYLGNRKYKEVIINAPDKETALNIFLKERYLEEDRDLYFARSIESVKKEEIALKEAGVSSWEEWEEQMHPERPIEL